MNNTAFLVLENGISFQGKFFGARGDITGEIVFTTGMTGYLETLTDPSYYGQIVLQTFPLIGNYGVIPSDFESSRIRASAYIVKHPSHNPSNFRSESNLDFFLQQQGIIGLYGIDTRALTRIIREHGVMNGKITHENPKDIDLNELKSYQIQNAVREVSISEKQYYTSSLSSYTVALLDFGAKENIKRELLARGCNVWVLPSHSKADEIMELAPNGIMLSNGPGDPSDNQEIIATIRQLLKTGVPIFGICLGHQLLALANGFLTHKLKYGHRGTNQPVKCTQNGRVYISSQNHGYAVSSESIRSYVADEWFINGNDGTCEGLLYKKIPAFSVQFHPEACAGPHDTSFLFDHFTQSMEVHKHAT